MSKSSLTLEKRETKREMKDRKTAILIFIDGIAQEWITSIDEKIIMIW